MKNPGLLTEVFLTKRCPFCLFFSFAFSQVELVNDFSPIHCFALLAQASVYFVPSISHCCTEGIVLIFLFWVITNANVQIDISSGTVQTLGQQVLKCC